MLDRAETARLIGSETYRGGWIDRRAGAIQPLSYVRGLAAAALARGAAIYSRSAVTGMTQVGGRWRLTTGTAEVIAEKVLITTGAYSGMLAGDLRRTFIAPNSFQVATRPLSANVRRSILGEGQVASDARRLLLYYRVDHTGRLLIGGRGTFRDPDGPDGFRHLERALFALFPQASGTGIEFRWSGRVGITLDHMPHIHKLAPGVAAVLGFNGRGVALSSALGIAMADWLMTGDDEAVPLPFAKVRRIPMHWAQELYVAMGSTWYRFRDWMT